MQVNIVLLAAVAPVELLPPPLHTVECFLVCDIVGQQDGMSSPIVEGTNRGKLLLSRRVPGKYQAQAHRLIIRLLSVFLPNLKFDDFVLQRESFDIEIHPNGGERVTVEIVVHIPLHQGRLPAGLKTKFGLSCDVSSLFALTASPMMTILKMKSNLVLLEVSGFSWVFS